MINTHPGFFVEDLRKKLLADRKYHKLVATYSQKFPQIPADNSGDFWDQLFAEELINHPMETDRNHLVADYILPEERVLNLGAGRGLLEAIVSQKIQHLNWIGTDITAESLRRLREKYPQYTFLSTPLESLPFEKQSFDQVVLLEVLEHVQPSHTFAVLKEIRRVIAEDGQFIISVPVNENLRQMFPTNPNSHVRDYSLPLLLFELRVAGFKPIKVHQRAAFHHWYQLKSFINNLLELNKVNNVIVICRPDKT